MIGSRLVNGGIVYPSRPSDDVEYGDWSNPIYAYQQYRNWAGSKRYLGNAVGVSYGAYKAYKKFYSGSLGQNYWKPDLSGPRSGKNNVNPGETVIKKNDSMQFRGAHGGGHIIKTKGKRRRRARGSKLVRTVKRLSKTVMKMPKPTTHQREFLKMGVASCSIGQVGYKTQLISDGTRIEEIMDSIEQLNTSAPGTGTTVNVTSITRPTKFKYDIFSNLAIRNNGSYPVKLVVYVLMGKDDGISETAQTTLTTAANYTIYNATAGSATAATDPINYPTMVQKFNEYWKIVKKHEVHMKVGDEYEANFSRKGLTYNQEEIDNQTTSIHGKLFAWLIRIVGTIAHDSVTTTSVGLTSGVVDYLERTRHTVRYHSGLPGAVVREIDSNWSNMGNGIQQKMLDIE